MTRADLSHPEPWIRRAAWHERYGNVRRSWGRWFVTRAANRRVPL